MEPTPRGGVLDDLARQLFGTADPATIKRRQRVWTVQQVRSMAIDVAIILALGIAVMACIPLVIWLWMVVL